MNIQPGDILRLDNTKIFSVDSVDHILGWANGSITTVVGPGIYHATKCMMSLIDGLVFDWAGINYGQYIPIKDQSEPAREPVCDCGGHKVYKSWSKEFHSSWCSCNLLLITEEKKHG